MENKDILDNDPQWERSDPPAEELAKVRKLLKAHDRKTVTKSVTVIAALVLIFAFVVVPLTETLYWNPDMCHYDENFSDLYLTLDAYLELLCPGKEFNGVLYSKAGYATYDLRVSIADNSKEVWEKWDATLELGDLWFEADFYETDPKDVLPFRRLEDYEQEEYLDTLRQLPEYITIRAAVTFPEDQDMAQVFAFWQDHTWSNAEYPLSLDWVAVRNCGSDESRRECGFSMKHYGPAASTVNNYYPEFHISDLNPDGKYLEQHFKSLLQYSSDQWEKGRGMDVTIGSNYYEKVLDYVEENGVMSYGVIVSGSPQALLHLLEEGAVSQIRILDAWLDVE